MTWEAFLALPYETRNASLINEHIVFCPPDPLHELVVANLLVNFVDWMRDGEHLSLIHI